MTLDCRAMLLGAILLLAPAFASAQTLRVDRGEVLKPAIFNAKVTKEIKDANISTGQHIEAKVTEITEITTLIRAKPEMFFGLETIVHGKPNNKPIPVRIVWRYPSPGLINPQGGAPKFTDEYTTDTSLEQPKKFFWHLTEAWHIVPGVWTFEMWYRDRKLIGQNFNVTNQ